MKVIERKNKHIEAVYPKWNKTVDCINCGSVLAVEEKDIIHYRGKNAKNIFRDFAAFLCPVCNIHNPLSIPFEIKKRLTNKQQHLPDEVLDNIILIRQRNRERKAR